MKFIAAIALLLMAFVASVKTNAQDTVISPSIIITGEFLGETPPLRDLPSLSEADLQRLQEKARKKLLNPEIEKREYPFAETALPKGPDPAWQMTMGNNRETHSPVQSFDGSETPNFFPTDANGTIGPNHYMQAINTVYTIYNRAGAVVAGPTDLYNLFYWLPGGDVNDGDPIVLYDEQADRWLLAEFSWTGANNYMLIAVSTTNDPTGTWYKYSFSVANKPDYEKFGIWRDGYYMGTNNPISEDIFVFQRSQMLSGQSALMVGFDNPDRPSTWDGFVVAPPLDNDGEFAPDGKPGLFIAFNDDAVGGGSDELWIYELDVDWDTPANSIFGRVQQLSVASFDSNFGSNYLNITQPSGTNVVNLDAIPMVIMNPPQYRNFGSYETIVCCHTVDVNGTNRAGIRWYEIRRVGSGIWTIRQQSTYSPDANSRWMGSIMLNGSNEIALGYSISSSTVYPGIRYCGQSTTAYSAANSTLDVAEDVITTGFYSQTGYARWGDYSGLQVDVADDETFWYTNQYIGASNLRKTKIANFQIDTPILTANFASSNTNPQIYSTVRLNDASVGSPTSWNWTITPSTYNFINNTSSTSQDPLVQFTAADNYTVELTITKGANNDTETKANFISVGDCPNLNLPYTEDFSDGVLPSCWKIIDNVGNGHFWLFNNPYPREITTNTGDNGVAILDSDYFGMSYQQHADLISPLFNFSDYSTVTVAFQQYFRIYGTGPPYSAYGRLYYSLNDGLSWTQKAIWAGTYNGYTWSQSMPEVAGQSKVRFKWNYKGYGYYWAIDDISITGTGPNIWTGTTSTDWATTTNWSTGAVPTNISNVIIPASATNWPNYTGNFVLGTDCDKLTMYGSSQLTVTGNFTISPGKTLAVTGNGQINIAGNFTNNGIFSPGSGTTRFYGSSATAVVTSPQSYVTNYIRTTFPKGMIALVSPTTGPTGNNVGSNVSFGTSPTFNFNYLGTNYNSCRICTNGWISLNQTGNAASDNTFLFSTTAPGTTLAPWFDDLNDDATSVVSYKTEGTSPYRVFTAEWKSVLTYSGTVTERISFQVKLYETTNVIEFLYGNLEPGNNNSSEGASIGIEDATGGSTRFIDATTGSTTTGLTNLTSTSNWPTVNYRFLPPASTQTFWNLTSEKSSSTTTISPSTYVNGAFTISSGTVVGPGTAAGILQVKGNWSNNGTYTPGSGTVLLNGSSNQNIGGNAATTFTKLTVNNAAGITLQNNETVSGTLTMSSGNIDCGSNTLQLGTSASAVGILNWTAGNIAGNFKRWIAASTTTPIDFPLGTSANSHNARITFSNNTGGSLTANFIPGDPGNNTGFPLTENSQTIYATNLYTEGSWTLVPATLGSTNYALELTGTGFTSAGPPDATVRILKRPDGGGDWTLNGAHVDGSAPVAKRSGLSGFSRFILAKPGQGNSISGNIKYYNQANTPLMTGITVKLYLDGSQVGSDFNVTNGTYLFSNLNPGTYELRVNSSGSVDGSINTTDAAQTNYWGALPYEIEKVRFYAGDVTGATFFINGTDAQRIQSNFVNGTAFDKGSWAFWKAGETISSNSNPPESYPIINLSSGNITANVYGLCAGDFNRSFNPGLLNTASTMLELIYSGFRDISSQQEFELPVKMVNATGIGAVSLILNFPADLVEVRDVLMNDGGGQLDWAVRDNELRIGWNTKNPVYLSVDEVLLILKLKTTDAFTAGNAIRLSLATSPLNELANEKYEVIGKAVLSIEVINAVAVPGR